MNYFLLILFFWQIYSACYPVQHFYYRFIMNWSSFLFNCHEPLDVLFITCIVLKSMFNVRCHFLLHIIIWSFIFSAVMSWLEYSGWSPSYFVDISHLNAWYEGLDVCRAIFNCNSDILFNDVNTSPSYYSQCSKFSN